MTTVKTVVDGLSFAEGPRWHDGALWFSDIHGGAVHRVERGVDRIVIELDERPSGLGWLPGGDLLVVCMKTARLVRVAASGTVTTHADLSGWVRGTPNDMIVRRDGVAYVGDMGMRMFEEEGGELQPGQILSVSPTGTVEIAVDGVKAPNGMILTDDERTLVLAESAGLRLSAFDVDTSGALSGMRTFAELHPSSPDALYTAPDGICLDAEGAVWVADPGGARVFRVLEGGEVTDEHVLDGRTPVACVLGGVDRSTLFVCAAEGWTLDEVANRRTGRVFAIEVAVPGAGAP